MIDVGSVVTPLEETRNVRRGAGTSRATKAASITAIACVNTELASER